MYKFGKKPPRVMESFGVAGLLGDDCQIFYDSLFSTRHLGRVSDLLSARLKKSGCDELRLRALLLFGVFEAYRAEVKLGEPGSDIEEGLTEPMVIECGIDEEKIAMGVAFTVPPGVPLDFKGMPERIAKGEATGPFEAMMSHLHGQSDRVVMRVHAPIRRIEIVALLALPGKIETEQPKDRPPVYLLQLTKPAEPPKASSYIELGDLDYPKLLREDSPGKTMTMSPMGEIIAKGIKEPTELLESLRVRGQGAQQGETTVRIAGTTQKLGGGSDKFVVKGGAGAIQAQDQSVFKISGGGGASAQVDVEAYETKIRDLQKRLTVAESVAARAIAAVKAGPVKIAGAAADVEETSAEATAAEETESEETAEEEEQPQPQAKSGGLGGLFKKKGLLKTVWPFKKKDEDEDDEDEEESAEQAGATSAEETEESATPEAPKPFGKIIVKGEEPPAPAPVPGAANPEGAVNNLMAEIQSGSLDRTLSKAQKEAAEMKKELGSGRAKRWMDGLMNELVSEKARLHEMAKKLNTSVRQKELEFRIKEQTMHEELRRRDDMLRQKNTALNRAKDQVSQLNITLERVKAQNVSATDDAHYKSKYQLSQKLLSSTKDENAMLNGRVEELKNLLANSQLLAAKRGNAQNPQEMVGLQEKIQRLARALEDQKRSNAELNNRLGEATKKSGGAAAEEARKRLEATGKMLTVSQRENETLKLRLDELMREEQRLRKEIEELVRKKAG